MVIITCQPSYETAVQALRNQVHDYVEKPFDLNYLRATVAQALAQSSLPLIQAGQESARRKDLTRREGQVLAQIAAGQSNKQIADALTISEKTVETHLGNLRGKLGLASRTEAAVWALAAGLGRREGPFWWKSTRKNGGFP